MPLRIHTRVPLNFSHGYGRDGIGLCRALIRRGYDVTVDPVMVGTPLPADMAQLLTKAPNFPSDIYISHVNPTELQFPEDFEDRYYKKIAFTMWEWDSFSPDDAIKVKQGLEQFDIVFAYDEESRDALLTTNPENVDIRLLQGGYEPDQWADSDGHIVERDWFTEDDFTFLLAGDLSARKGPTVLARALANLWDEGYKFKLVLKNRFKNIFPPYFEQAYSDFMTIHNGIWTTEQMRKLYESAHCYVAPSWGEGKNLPALEAGTSGAALILSPCGGHKMWGREEFALFTESVLVDDPSGLKHKEVTVESLTEACRFMLENRDVARKMGQAAHDIIPKSMTWDSVVERMLLEIQK